LATNDYDSALDVAVSPDDATVYVTGQSACAMTTAAYAAATGQAVWADRCHGPGRLCDVGEAVDVSPDAARVYVTGLTAGFTGTDVATIAYDAATGSRVWQAVYNSSWDGYDEPCCIRVSPDGARLFVAATSEDPLGLNQYVTIAYDSVHGGVLWNRAYAHDESAPNALAVS